MSEKRKKKATEALPGIETLTNVERTSPTWCKGSIVSQADSNSRGGEKRCVQMLRIYADERDKER